MYYIGIRRRRLKPEGGKQVPFDQAVVALDSTLVLVLGSGK